MLTCCSATRRRGRDSLRDEPRRYRGSLRANDSALDLKFASEKPALEGVSEGGNVHKKAVFVNILPTDLPRNEGQIRPLIEKLEHNGERLKVWAERAAT